MVRRKILLVEDDESLSVVLAESLRAAGYETRIAADALEGFLEFMRFQPDIVISDLQLPGKNGVAMVRRLRAAHHADVRTIYMSGDLSQFGSELEAEKHRPEVSILAKPFSRNELMRLVSAQ